MNLNLIEIGIGALVIIVGFVILFLTSFVSASPGEIKVISGPRGQRVIHGKTGWKIPILERVDSMTAEMISIDVKTSDYVPTNDFINVKVVAAVKVRIGTEKPELFKAATRNFLYKTTDVMADEVRDTLEGHLRAIIGQMELKKIIQDRVTFSEKVQENATKNLEEMGLEIVAFNVQSVVDEKGVIENLGIDNTEKIRKDAAKAKAVAYQEVAEQEAKSQKIANDARVEADLEIAKKNNELEIKIAELKVNFGDNKFLNTFNSIIVCEKNRDFNTGKILNVIAKIEKSDDMINYSIPKEVYIIDDICSYGGTFIAVKKAVKELLKKSKLEFNLIVTHTEDVIEKGEVLKEYNEVFTTDSLITIEHPKINILNLSNEKIFLK